MSESVPFGSTVRDGVLRVASPDARWLSSGWDGGFVRADAAYNVSVPEGWDRTDLDAYVRGRRADAGFETDGPALLTGVDLSHAAGARAGSVTVYATAGVSNPAALPMDDAVNRPGQSEAVGEEGERTNAGTVNLLVGTTRALDDGALANLLAVAVEAKTATLLAATGFPGTTTDAVVVGCDPAGETATFSGSATPVGSAVRACVRDAVRESLRSRYAERDLPDSVADAEYGVVTSDDTEVFSP
ncbi:adenosylcobinamide amidohydrolase [Halomarina salina]|uniref:Adenosylcobinamide amidohydrolase n=1 Tax=Halomarina salina TaxID=1872699 RepID=A0ABD5RHC4_9EURY|nr:adenosylcobinamide amidohydrolase [Halomarina salina]